MTDIREKCRKAASCALSLACTDTSVRNGAILRMAELLESDADGILDANLKDLAHAGEHGISDAMLDRLRLTKERITGIADALRTLAALPDPLGKGEVWKRPNGLEIKRVRVPLGVIAIIYESRPNVTADAAALCIKSGNAVVLRGGSEAINSNLAIVSVLKRALEESGINSDVLAIASDTSRETATELMKMREYVDLLIPRGGKGLISACVKNATVPCIETGTGICHIYVDKSADLAMALSIVENAKTSRPSVCNAAEVCLVHREIADAFLPKLKEILVDKRIAEGKMPVELRLDGQAANIISGTPAGAEDFDTEFLDYILAVAVVDDVTAAATHIAEHSTGHSEAIIAQDPTAMKAFISLVDSAAVYVNASTRFTDGGEFGLGCEMGISTQKLHARGPMGLAELTSYQYRITGNGQIR